MLYFSIEDGPKQILIRAVGPTLKDFGITDSLADPEITLLNPNTQEVLASNSGWQASPAIATASAAVGALPLDSKAADAALLATLSTGTWAVAVKSASGGSGEVNAEFYETDQSGRLVYSGTLVQKSHVLQLTSLGSLNSPTVLFRAISSGLAISNLATNQGPITLAAFNQSGTSLNLVSGSAGVPNYTIPASTAGDFVAAGSNADVAAVFGVVSSQISVEIDAQGAFSGLSELSVIDNQRSDYPPSLLIPPQGSGQYSAGVSLTLSVTALGRPLPTYQWQKDGTDIPGATDRIYNLSNAQVADSGRYQAKVTNSLGSVLTPAATIAVVTIPVISTQPVAVQAVGGAAPILSVAVSNPAVDSFQWYLDGTAVVGATGQTLTLSKFSSSQAGNYTITIANAAGSVTSQAAIVTLVDYSRIANLSILASASTAAPLTVGYTITGSTTNATLPALLRATGPSLSLFGIPNFLTDPSLAIYGGTSIIGTNDNWGTNQQSVRDADDLVLAFPLPDSTSADAALTQAFSPGPYSMVIKGAGTSAGLVLAEIYDATTPTNIGTGAPRLINISSLAQIGSSNASLTAGFVILGTTSKTVLIRGIGPTLKQLGVNDAAAQVQLTVYNQQSTVIATNSSWGGSTVLANTFAQVQAFPLPAGSADTALVLTLNPGPYTAAVTPLNGASGSALVEIYEVP